MTTSEAIQVVETRTARRSTDRLAAVMTYREAPIEAQLDALEAAQGRGDWVTAQVLEESLDRALPATATAAQRVGTTTARARWATVQDARVAPALRAQFAGLTAELQAATAPALAQVAGERVSAGDLSHEAINALFLASRRPAKAATA